MEVGYPDHLTGAARVKEPDNLPGKQVVKGRDSDHYGAIKDEREPHSLFCPIRFLCTKVLTYDHCSSCCNGKTWHESNEFKPFCNTISGDLSLIHISEPTRRTPISYA